jgi:hypothetical protein
MPPAHLDDSQQLALPLEDIADRGSIRFGDDEHAEGTSGWMPQSASAPRTGGTPRAGRSGQKLGLHGTLIICPTWRPHIHGDRSGPFRSPDPEYPMKNVILATIAILSVGMAVADAQP